MGKIHVFTEKIHSPAVGGAARILTAETLTETDFSVLFTACEPGTVIAARNGEETVRITVTERADQTPLMPPGQAALCHAAHILAELAPAKRNACIGLAFSFSAPRQEGQTVTFTCRITGEDEPQIQHGKEILKSLAEDGIYGTETTLSVLKKTPPYLLPAPFFEGLRRACRALGEPIPQPIHTKTPLSFTPETPLLECPVYPGDRTETLVARVKAWIPQIPAKQTLFFAAPLTDRCLLQRETPFAIFGSATPGKTVTVTVKDCTALAVADKNGHWQASFPPQPPSEIPCEIIAEDGEEQIFIAEVLFGDVWLLGGQSNMEHSLAHNPQVNRLNRQARHETRAPLRMLVQRLSDAFKDPEKQKTPQRDFCDPVRSAWRTPTEANLAEVSTVGWYFAEELQKQLRIPVGIISLCAGSSCLAQLASPRISTTEPFMRNANSENRSVPPSGIYNTMTAPLLGLKAKGMLFYQGESDQPRFDIYGDLMETFVADVREDFGQALHFSFVQLSSHPIWDRVPEIRAQQYKALKIPDTTLTVARDLGWRPGDMETPHPNYKGEIGLRMAKQILFAVYGKGDASALPPLPQSPIFCKNQVTIPFNHPLAGAGTGFEILQDNQWTETLPLIDGNTVTLTGDREISGVRFAFRRQAGPEFADLKSVFGYQAPTFEFIKGEEL